MELKKHPVVCFGEVLWDILPSGAVPGGAPMNVAYHLHRQGKSPALITRTGNDEKGKGLVDLFREFGLCTTYFQVDDLHETGKVFATPNEHHEMSYEIVQPVAWDFIAWEARFANLFAGADYFVFGSLAAGNAVSRSTLFQALETATTNVLDINLRPPHFSRDLVADLLSKADFLKLNGAELELISGWLFPYNNTADQVRGLGEKFKIEKIVVTRGAEGSCFLHEGILYEHPGFPVSVADTVGSGDAFLAGLLGELLNGASPGEALASANALGAFVATRRGACPAYSLDQVAQLSQNHVHATSKL